MAAPANPHLYKPIVSSTGSQICWNTFPGAFSYGNQLAFGISSSKWRVCSSASTSVNLGGIRGFFNQRLIYVDEVLDSSTSDDANSQLITDSALESSSSSSSGDDFPDLNTGTSPEVPPEPGLSTTDSLEAPIEPGISTTDALRAPIKDLLPDFAPSQIETPDSAAGNSGADAFSAATNEASSALKTVADSVSSTLVEIQETGASFISGIKEKVTSSVQNAEDSVNNVYENFNKFLLKAIKGNIAVSSEQAPINDTLKDVVIFVKDGAGKIFAAVDHAVSEGYGFVKAAAPTEVQTTLDIAERKLQGVLSPLSSALQQALESIANLEKAVGFDPDNPIVPIFLLGGGSIYLGVLYWKSKYGGYAGDLPAETVLELLNKESNIVLVDIRPQELKERDGVPDVRRRGRFRVASIDPLEVERPVRNLVRNADDVDDLLTATLIRNLKSVKTSTKVIVMDADGTESKKVAKAVRRTGISKCYRLDGGFAAWMKLGLRQKTDGQETPLSILKEETEAVVNELTPAGVIAIALGSVAAGYAVYEWEKTLQLLGVLAIFQVIYQRLDSYSSVEDFEADIRILQKPFRFVVSWLGGQSKPKLELATSPSTTAVQDRVVQAAAKHRPSSSSLAEQDLQDVQDERDELPDPEQKTPSSEEVEASDQP